MALNCWQAPRLGFPATPTPPPALSLPHYNTHSSNETKEKSNHVSSIKLIFREEAGKTSCRCCHKLGCSPASALQPKGGFSVHSSLKLTGLAAGWVLSRLLCQGQPSPHVPAPAILAKHLTVHRGNINFAASWRKKNHSWKCSAFEILIFLP